MTRLRLALVLALALTGLTGCPNIFDPLDSPSGDEQLLSAARACFDRQDYACAREYYGKLGGDTAKAEEAFMILDEQNLGTDALVIAVAGANGGTLGEIINRLVEKAAKEGASPTKRAALLSAYNKIAGISNAEVQGFVQFVVAMTLAAELLAEQTGVVADYILNKTDMAASATCTVATCGTAACDPAAGALVEGAATDADELTAPASYGTVSSADVPANLVSFSKALTAAATGLNAINVNSGSTLSLINQISGLAAPTSGPLADCYRAGLFDLGVGR